MTGHSLLLNLCGGIALLIWATRMVKTGVLRAFGDQLRRAIGCATANPVRACAAGTAVATVLQSSTATALLLVSFAERGLIGLAAALAVMLGADLGSTLVVQVLSFDLAALVPILLIAGVAAFTISDSAMVRQLGRVVIGLALMILSLGLIVGASAPLRENELLGLVLQRLAGDPLLAMLIAAALTWLIHSSVAVVLLFISLAAVGILSPAETMAVVLGANIGSGLIPVGLSLRSPPPARRILFGNLAFRTLAALAVLPFVDQIGGLIAAIETDPARQIANFHTGFNLALMVLFLPLTGVAARLLERFVPDAASPAGEARIVHLDDAVLDRPAIAIAGATREVLRLADTVEVMLRETILTFEESDGKRRQEISRLDNTVDAAQEAIKLYLTRITRSPLSEEDSRRCFDLILFNTNLEHIGDIIDKGLLELAAKKQRRMLAFSDVGWSEIAALHKRVTDQMRLAMTVFVTRDLAMARALVAEKEEIRRLERRATESHLQRLRDGTVASIETSAIHLDILRDLKRITSHLASVAYPILEAQGELRSSRLQAAPDRPDPAGATLALGGRTADPYPHG